MADAPGRFCRIAIIGGGAIGTSIAYHLANAGETDVLLIEKSQITHGCTWHAAGLVGQLRGKRNLTRLMQNSVAVFDRLHAESDQPIDWKKVGSLRLASSPDRWSEIRRSMSQAKSFGVACEELSAAEARSLFPFIDPSGIEGAAFIPGDGYIDPYALTQAYARAARRGGVTIEEGITVTDIVTRDRRVTSIVTDAGTIGCEILVNCAGLWAKRVGAMADVPIAAGVVEHQYFLTEKSLEFGADLPTLRDPDNNFYLKPDTGAFAIGGWEDGTVGCWRSMPPLEFGRELFPPNMERLERFALPATTRLPILNDIGVQSVINGPIPVSPDGEPIIGITPELDNLFVACGFTAGIAASGGAGEAMANWILHGDPGMDLWAFDIRRFGLVHAQPRYLEACAIEAYSAYYKIHWPGEEAQAGRGLRRSPLYDRLKAAGAVYGSKFGWERPNWFASDGVPPIDVPSFEDKPNWFNAVGAECRAIRTGVALIDQSSFSKFELAGQGAFAALNRIAANRIPEEPGAVVYTQLCNERGGIEADLTIIHAGPDRFLVVTGSGFGVRDRHWIECHLDKEDNVRLRDISNTLATINICGPQSRAVLQSVSDADLSNAAFPFLAVRNVDIGHASALAVRIGYVGELGWELYVPQDYAGHVYDTLWEAGKAHGIANAGYRAIESCRLEKGYLYWSADIGPDVTPYEAGLGFCVAPDKSDFVGRNALQLLRSRATERTVQTLTIDGFRPLHGSEPILQDGEVIGSVSSAGYGHTVGKTIAFALLPANLDKDKTLKIELFGALHSATRQQRCLYDPKMERLKS